MWQMFLMSCEERDGGKEEIPRVGGPAFVLFMTHIDSVTRNIQLFSSLVIPNGQLHPNARVF